jgi:hypothetical protein
MLSQDATTRIHELEAGEAAIALQLTELEEITVGHLAAVYGDRLVFDESVQTLLRYYLPELAGPTGDHQHDDASAVPPRPEGW